MLGSWRPKRALLVLMVLFVAGNALSAVATGYGVLLLGRVVAALAHGAFFGIGSVVAASLVPYEKRTAAVATILGGLGVANVVGVPVATLEADAHARQTFNIVYDGEVAVRFGMPVALILALEPAET